MNKKEILQNHYAVFGMKRLPHHGSVLDAMDEYAKQQSIAFGNWKDEKIADVQAIYHNGRWHADEGHGFILGTNEQLYDQFLIWQNKQNENRD